jgi:sulfopyruvate decarboxylase subunit beta
MATNDNATPLVAALEVLRDVRGDRAVITSMGSAREWLKFAPHSLDFHYLPSTMGGAIPLALGLALAKPDREFIVITGDGSLLMNLGALITVAASEATNLTIVLINNGVYEVTGRQTTTAGAVREARKQIDFASIALSSGITSVRRFEDLDKWRLRAEAMLARPGPRFLELVVAPTQGEYRLESPGPMPPRLEAFRTALSAE